jgi:hypothetical protein
MGVGTLTLNLERYRVVDYATFFLEEPTTILIPPPTKEARLFACVRPFQLKVKTVKIYKQCSTIYRKIDSGLDWFT